MRVACYTTQRKTDKSQTVTTMDTIDPDVKKWNKRYFFHICIVGGKIYKPAIAISILSCLASLLNLCNHLQSF